jgi:phosphoribosyl 1,2-cyclic phosphodiesterase
VGFAIHVGGRQITVITDTGTIPVEAHALIQQSDVLFMEANYDETMLLRGPYPPFLKKRIAGKQGHLSNNEVIELLNKCPPLPHAKHYFCHLSKVNNHPKVLAQ